MVSISSRSFARNTARPLLWTAYLHGYQATCLALQLRRVRPLVIYPGERPGHTSPATRISPRGSIAHVEVDVTPRKGTKPRQQDRTPLECLVDLMEEQLINLTDELAKVPVEFTSVRIVVGVDVN